MLGLRLLILRYQRQGKEALTSIFNLVEEEEIILKLGRLKIAYGTDCLAG